MSRRLLNTLQPIAENLKFLNKVYNLSHPKSTIYISILERYVNWEKMGILWLVAKISEPVF